MQLREMCSGKYIANSDMHCSIIICNYWELNRELKEMYQKTSGIEDARLI